MSEDIKPSYRGVIGWMTHNRVTPNLIMLVCLVGGFFLATRIKQEVFPEFELDIVNVIVPYPGASPEEVEQGIVLAVEEAIRGLDGIKEVTATASEGVGVVTAELLDGGNTQRVYQEIRQEVDRITTFPQDAERPEVRMIMRRREVMRMQIYGEVSEWVIRELAEQVRDGLLQTPGITQVDLVGVRDYEVQVLIDQDTLRRYGLTPAAVASRIRAAAVELPGGHIETHGGEVLLRVTERRDWAAEFASIPIITTPAGTALALGDIARVVDDFADVDKSATFDGKRAVGIAVFRVGDQTPIGVSKATRQAMEKLKDQLPPGVSFSITRDDSEVYRQRLELLIENGLWGLLLVMLLLGAFLEIKLAFWVTMGIPVSFLGSFLFLPAMDVTINMVSMFAYIIALGIVVDDAIVVGENIYDYRSKGMNPLEAAIKGAGDVSMPVIISVLTNMVTFVPLLFVPGVAGKIWKVIPLVVITVFTISLVESQLVLPTHLAHLRPRSKNRAAVLLHELQQIFSQWFERFIERRFGPFLSICLSFRFVTTSLCLAVLIGIVSYVASGRIGVIMMPRVEADYAAVEAILPFGSPSARVQETADILTAAARAVVDENGKDTLCAGIFAEIDEDKVEVRIFLTDPEIRPISTTALTQLWRQRVGTLAGVESIVFEADRGGPGSGAALTVELSPRSIDTLDAAGKRLAEILADFSNVKDINDGFRPGKEQLNFTIKSEGQSIGLTAQEIARQVRNAFYGAEALRQQRGRNEVRVRVKYPKEQRLSEYNIEQMLIRTPAGTDVPLMEVAQVQRGRSYTSISRRDSRRTILVTANVEPIDQTNQVIDTLKSTILPQLAMEYPGLSYGWEGQQADFRESTRSLFSGFMLALGGIYAMLAIPFRSYIQPLIIMVAIPFGIVGAVLGHQIMGYSLSLMSLMGIVALSGVVVNDALVLIDYANQLMREEGLSAFAAMVRAGIRRFRPIMLTTLTTFGGLSPMIFETSRQARFMIPMALSLGFGIVFATAITLLIVPCLYVMLDDALQAYRRFRAFMDA